MWRYLAGNSLHPLHPTHRTLPPGDLTNLHKPASCHRLPHLTYSQPKWDGTLLCLTPHGHLLTPRMHSKGKGMSASALPYRRSQPSWSKATPEEVTDQIFKFARRGLSPSQIGVILRDSHGVPQVKSVTGNKILRILKTNG